MEEQEINKTIAEYMGEKFHTHWLQKPLETSTALAKAIKEIN